MQLWIILLIIGSIVVTCLVIVAIIYFVKRSKERSKTTNEGSKTANEGSKTTNEGSKTTNETPTQSLAPAKEYNLGLQYKQDSNVNEVFPIVQNILDSSKQYACEKIPKSQWSQSPQISCAEFEKKMNDSLYDFYNKISMTNPSLSPSVVTQLKPEAEKILSILNKRVCVNGTANPGMFITEIYKAICASKSQVPTGFIGTTYITNDGDIISLLQSFSKMIRILTCGVSKDIYGNNITKMFSNNGQSLKCNEVMKLIDTLTGLIESSLGSTSKSNYFQSLSSNIRKLLTVFVITKGCNGNASSDSLVNTQAIESYVKKLNSSFCED